MIVVTVPHSFCYTNYFERDCDLVAGVAASTLVKELKKKVNTGFEIVELQSTVHRSQMDLNRYVSRNTSFRKQLTGLLKGNRVEFVLDVHSFPKSEFGGSEITILDNPPMTPYSNSLYTTLVKNNINANYLTGSPSSPSNPTEGNDIIEESRDRGVRAVIIEYNETLSNERIKAINKIIVNQWLISLLSK